MNAPSLPKSTPYDPAEDPPGSIDPLGTIAGAEQIAEVLLPGLTARMWRTRLLTFAAVAAVIARRVADGREDRLLDARLAFERLFVSALAHQEAVQENRTDATRRLPGIGLARQALRLSDQPLGPANFLKGQAANGPFGVISRLARAVGVVDDAGELGQGGIDLLTTWSAEQNLPGLLDDGAQSEGGKWLRSVARKVADHLDDQLNWPPRGWSEWAGLATRLGLDDPGAREREVIRRLLSQDALGLRGRVISRLESPAVFQLYRKEGSKAARGRRERTVLVGGLRDGSPPRDEIDRTIGVTIDLIDAYESVAGLLESAFRSLLWGLTRHSGQATPSAVVGEPRVERVLSDARTALGPAAGRVRAAIREFETNPLARQRGSVELDRLRRLSDEAQSGSASVDACVTVVLERHRRVQREKEKGVWIEDGNRWTLMPGFGDSSEEPARHGDYIHSFRVTNAYSLLADLDHRLKVEAGDGEAEDE